MQLKDSRVFPRQETFTPRPQSPCHGSLLSRPPENVMLMLMLMLMLTFMPMTPSEQVSHLANAPSKAPLVPKQVPVGTSRNDLS